VLCLYLSLPNQGPTTWSTKVLVSHGLELSQGSIGSICQAVGQRKNAGGYGCKKMWKHFPQLFSRPKDPKVLLTYHIVPHRTTVPHSFSARSNLFGSKSSERSTVNAPWAHREHAVTFLELVYHWSLMPISCAFQCKLRRLQTLRGLWLRQLGLEAIVKHRFVLRVCCGSFDNAFDPLYWKSKFTLSWSHWTHEIKD
jgi:hypothetical protein